MELKPSITAWALAAAADPPEKDIAHMVGHQINHLRAVGGTEMFFIMKIDIRTISRKESRSITSTETGSEKEIGTLEKKDGGSIQSSYGLITSPNSRHSMEKPSVSALISETNTG